MTVVSGSDFAGPQCIELLWLLGATIYEKCILETGKKQPEAIGLHQKNGYKIIPNYGQYAEIENSLCFEKDTGPTRKPAILA